jgi:DNA-binding MarR family transcriptional regulator
MSPAELTSHLGYWLRLVSNHVSHAFARKLQAFDITVAEWALMRVLFGIDESPSQLAERMGMTKGAITKLADRLIAKSLVIRISSRDDRRSQTLRLSKKAKALSRGSPVWLTRTRQSAFHIFPKRTVPCLSEFSGRASNASG